MGANPTTPVPRCATNPHSEPCLHGATPFATLHANAPTCLEHAEDRSIQRGYRHRSARQRESPTAKPLDGSLAKRKTTHRQPALQPLIDEIGAILAGHYGFTEEEMDFIVNYDLKCCLGRKAGDEE